MKFPLPPTTFPTMKFSNEQTQEFTDTRNRILDSAMEARQEFIERYNRQLDMDVWKRVKESASGVRIYRPRRFSHIPRPSSSISCSPLMVGVGSIPGTLDEVMLGMTAPTSSSMRFRASYLHKDWLDMRVLSTLEARSGVDPFEYMCIKWMVKSTSMPVRSFVRPRDFVYLESSGVRSDANGNRVGHLLLHSVELSCCRSLQYEFGLVRGLVSFCFLFAEDSENPGQVEVFLKGFFDPRGGVSERLAVSAAADSLLACEKAVHCGRMRKLAWQQRDPRTRHLGSEERDQCCDAPKSKAMECDVCRKQRCSKCVSCMLLAQASPHSTPRQQRLNVCACCVDALNAVSPSKVAASDASGYLYAFRRWSSPDQTVSQPDDEKVRLAPLKKRHCTEIEAPDPLCLIV